MSDPAAPVPASEDIKKLLLGFYWRARAVERGSAAQPTDAEQETAEILAANSRREILALVSRLRSQVERMKAEQMELIGKVIEQFRPAHPKRCTCGECQWWIVRASNTRKAALRRLSSDNSETGDTK